MVARKNISKALRQSVYEKYGGRCAYCGKRITLKDMQIDHINSVYNHGENAAIENLMPSCRSCNFYKSTMSIEKFREQIGKVKSRLEKVFIYRLARDYRLIYENNIKVTFYFEKIEEEKGE